MLKSRKNDQKIYISMMYDIPVGLQPNIVLLQAASSPTHNPQAFKYIDGSCESTGIQGIQIVGPPTLNTFPFSLCNEIQPDNNEL